jgi:hypothetical protein
MLFALWVAAAALAACSVDAVSFTGMVDAQVQPGTATLTITRDGTSTGTVSSNPAGIACGATCSAAFPVSSMITLTANPDTGTALAGWSGGGCTGSTPTCMVTVAAATTVTATFDIAEYPVTIELGGSGIGMVVAASAGITCPGSCTAMVPHDSQLSLAASTGAGSSFMGWTVGPGGTACTGTGACSTTITGPTTITATFALYQSLEVTKSGTGSGTVTSNPTGISCGADCSETYPPGTAVTLTASPSFGSTFTGWSGGCSGTGTCTVTMTAATSVTATFTLNSYLLSVGKAGTGSGSVTSSPGGISCGTDCSEVYIHGIAVTLTASPSFGSTFAGWSGGGCSGTGTCTVTMTAATSVTATFTLNSYLLSVGIISQQGRGDASVVSSPGGINCSEFGGGICSAMYAQGTTVTLIMDPGSFSIFSHWTGACAGQGSACTLTITGDTSTTGHAACDGPCF